MPPIYLLLQLGVAVESVVFVPYALKFAQSPVLVVAPIAYLELQFPANSWQYIRGKQTK